MYTVTIDKNTSTLPPVNQISHKKMVSELKKSVAIAEHEDQKDAFEFLKELRAELNI